MPLVLVGAIAGFIVALVTIFKPVWAGVTAPIYALLEGLFIGGLSSIAEAQLPRHRHPGRGPHLRDLPGAAPGL